MKTLLQARNKKGFTLMEMLIVVAIIAILIAIAIPVFSAQLNSAKDAVIDANMRSTESMAMVAFLTEDMPAAGYSADSTYYYVGTVDDATHALEISDSVTEKPATGEYIVGIEQGEIVYASHPENSKGVTVIVGE